MKSVDFKDLEVWRKSMDLVIEIYNLSNHFPQNEKFGLVDQIRRCVVSIPSNIAEGQARYSDKEFIRFLSIANGSSAELQTKL